MVHELNNYLIVVQWVLSDDNSKNINPDDVEEVIGLFTRASANDVSDFAQAADTAFDSWRNNSPQTFLKKLCQQY